MMLSKGNYLINRYLFVLKMRTWYRLAISHSSFTRTELLCRLNLLHGFVLEMISFFD